MSLESADPLLVHAVQSVLPEAYVSGRFFSEAECRLPSPNVAL